MIIIFAFFGYQKWFEYEAQALVPYISNGPLIFWMYPVFGIRGATYFLGVAEWVFGGLLLLGFWNKGLGILGALGSCFSFIATLTIIRIHARWVGCICWRIPGYDRESCIFNEGPRSARGVVLFAETGCNESLPRFDDVASFIVNANHSVV